jgi:hypothetical protein
MAFEGYSGEVPSWEMGYERNADHGIPNVKKMFFGMDVGECFIDVRRFAELPDANALEPWLDERWARKDRMLKRFASHNSTHSFREKDGDQEVTYVPGGNMGVGSLVFVTHFAAVIKLVHMGWCAGVKRWRG